LDPESSTPEQPVLLHRRELKLKPGEIVELNIEIWPGSTHFDVGEGLRLLVQGTDVMVLHPLGDVLLIVEIPRARGVYTT
jgi:predicted acyl esterase